jgi:hypothetical protein
MYLAGVKVGLDCRIGALETFREALQRGQRARRCRLQPPIEPLRLPHTEELRQAWGERDRLRAGSVCVVQSSEQGLLALVSVQVLQAGITPPLVPADHLWAAEQGRLHHGEPRHTPQ